MTTNKIAKFEVGKHYRGTIPTFVVKNGIAQTYDGTITVIKRTTQFITYTLGTSAKLNYRTKILIDGDTEYTVDSTGGGTFVKATDVSDKQIGKADKQACYISDKHNREVKPCDDNGAVFDLLPGIGDLNDVDSVPATEPKKDCTAPLTDDLIFVCDNDTKYTFTSGTTLAIRAEAAALKINDKTVAIYDSAQIALTAAERLYHHINYLNDYNKNFWEVMDGFLRKNDAETDTINYWELLDTAYKTYTLSTREEQGITFVREDGTEFGYTGTIKIYTEGKTLKINHDKIKVCNSIADACSAADFIYNQAQNVIKRSKKDGNVYLDPVAAKCNELKANYDAAKVATDNADAELFKAREIAEEKRKKAIAAADAKFKAKCAYHDFLRETAEQLTAKLLTDDVLRAKLLITSQRGTEFEHEKSLFALRVKDGYKTNFEIAIGYLVLAEYETPAQVEKVIDLLKTAINRGEKEFKFPTIDELNAPPPKKNSIPDSLTRAMEIALEECQKYCHEHNLPAAQNELELFKICSEALENHHAQATIQANCDSVNETAPEGWHVAPCADKPDQYQITYNGDNVTTLDSLVLAKILTPDKFFGQFAPLNDKNFSPQNQFIGDLKRELSELEKMRQELPVDSPQLKTLDDMIDQTNRDILLTEMSPQPEPKK